MLEIRRIKHFGGLPLQDQPHRTLLLDHLIAVLAAVLQLSHDLHAREDYQAEVTTVQMP